ncbi:MAG: hypothetical protein GEV10_14935 [Streptosporangiales bacterium]|nr:hypothetical protein [Streptosporangiales bacterium]
MQNYETRALEIHSDLMWREEEIRHALDLIERYEMNALILHEPDLLNRMTYPRRYFTPNSAWGAAPPRRGENLILNTTAYMRNVMAQCRRRGIDFFLNLKELAFPDEFMEIAPDVIVDGKVCPTHPAWAELIDARYTDLCEDYPDLAGVIVSVGSPEGRATLSSRKCGCERCAGTDAAEWYRWITEGLSRPLAKAGKRLVVREFSYLPADQDAVVAGLADLPADIEFAVKPYARDYYPTYPDNPALAALPERRRWLEYDVNGQYFGWGVFPCPVVDDLRHRLTRGLEVGATAVLLRTDWERINDLTALHNVNGLNLAAGALLARHPETSPVDALARALEQTNIVDPSVDPEVRLQVATTLLGLWPVVEKTLYIQGFVYNDSSRIPNGVDHAWWVFAENHNLDDWDPGAAARIDVSDPDVTAAMLTEKDRGRADLLRLVAEIRDWITLGVLRIPDVYRLGDVAGFMATYIEEFVASGKITILVRAAQRRDGGITGQERESLAAETTVLRDVMARTERQRTVGAHTHHVGQLLDTARMERMIADAEQVLAEEK